MELNKWQAREAARYAEDNGVTQAAAEEALFRPTPAPAEDESAVAEENDPEFASA